MRLFVLNVTAQRIADALGPPLSPPTMNFGEAPAFDYDGPLRPPSWDDYAPTPTRNEEPPAQEAAVALPPPMSVPRMF